MLSMSCREIAAPSSVQSAARQSALNVKPGTLTLSMFDADGLVSYVNDESVLP
jgi:hypothetical protein